MNTIVLQKPMKKYFPILLLLSAFCLASCEKEEDEPETPNVSVGVDYDPYYGIGD